MGAKKPKGAKGGQNNTKVVKTFNYWSKIELTSVA